MTENKVSTQASNPRSNVKRVVGDTILAIVTGGLFGIAIRLGFDAIQIPYLLEFLVLVLILSLTSFLLLWLVFRSHQAPIAYYVLWFSTVGVITLTIAGIGA